MLRSVLFTTVLVAGCAETPMLTVGGPADTDVVEPIDTAAPADDSGLDTAVDSEDTDDVDTDDVEVEESDTEEEVETDNDVEDTDEEVEDEESEADPFDNDGDGFAEADYYADCDDSRADVNPSEVEVCDGVDNDCDGEIDEGTACESTESEEIDTGEVEETDTDTSVEEEPIDTAAPADEGDTAEETIDTGDSAIEEDTAVTDTGDTAEETDTADSAEETDTAEEFPCTDCVRIVHTPSSLESSASAFYGEGTSCGRMEASYSVVTPTADGNAWVLELAVTDSYLGRFSIDYGGGFYSCNGSTLDGTVAATYYQADGVTSCEITIDELLKSSGGCELQFVASCPDTPPTCPAF